MFFRRGVYMANEIISINKIKAKVPADNWEQAVRAAGEILVAAGSISEKYIAGMIDAVHELGPYMVIMPGLAIAHAAPGTDGGVHCNDVALISLAEPVRFGSPNDPVSVVLCLSCTDHESHLASMRRVAKVIAADGVVERLAQAATDQAMYEIMNP